MFKPSWRRPIPHKREAAHPVIKTCGLPEHVSLSGTSPISRLPPWCSTRLADTLSRITPDVLTPDSVSYCVVRLQGGLERFLIFPALFATQLPQSQRRLHRQNPKIRRLRMGQSPEQLLIGAQSFQIVTPRQKARRLAFLEKVRRLTFLRYDIQLAHILVKTPTTSRTEKNQPFIASSQTARTSLSLKNLMENLDIFCIQFKK